MPATAIFGVPDDTLPQRLTMCLIGAAAVGVIGLLGRRVAGAAVGLTAAVITAVYPNLFVNDGIVMAEALTARLGRAFDAFRPFQTADFGTLEGRSKTVGLLRVVAYWLLIPFVIAGIVCHGGARSSSSTIAASSSS